MINCTKCEIKKSDGVKKQTVKKEVTSEIKSKAETKTTYRCPRCGHTETVIEKTLNETTETNGQSN